MGWTGIHPFTTTCGRQHGYSAAIEPEGLDTPLLMATVYSTPWSLLTMMHTQTPPIDLDILFNWLRQETTDNLHMYPKESDMNLISQMEDYIQHKIYKQFYVDLAPSVLANYLNVRLHVINEGAQGDCVLYTLDPHVEPMPLAIAVHRKELPDIGPHYSGVVPSKSQKPDTSARRQSHGEKRYTLSPSRYPGYVQLGDCSFYTLNEVNNEQHSPLSVILKQRSAISFNLQPPAGSWKNISKSPCPMPNYATQHPFCSGES